MSNIRHGTTEGNSATPDEAFLASIFDEADSGPTADDARWWAAELGWPEGNPPGEPLLPFAEWVRVRASMIRLEGTNAARWLAKEMDALAMEAERLHAETPDQFDGRSHADAEAFHAGLFQRGYDAALKIERAARGRAGFGHDA